MYLTLIFNLVFVKEFFQQGMQFDFFVMQDNFRKITEDKNNNHDYRKQNTILQQSVIFDQIHHCK